MRALLFTANSNSGWVGSFVSRLKESFGKLGVECAVREHNDFGLKEGGKLIDSFRPDWMFSFNQMFPNFRVDGELSTVYDFFQIPHYTYLVDNPYIWLTTKSINFDSEYLSVITLDNADILRQAGVKNCREILYGCPASLKNNIEPDSKKRSVLFAGSIGNTNQDTEKMLMSSSLTPEQKQAVFSYCLKVYENIRGEKRFLKQNLLTDFFISSSGVGLFDTKIKYNESLSEAFIIIERFYETLARESILSLLKKTNISCAMAGDEKMRDFCAGADNMLYQGMIPYERYLDMIGGFSVSLNITPKHLRVHDRITSTLMSGSLLVTTPVPKLVSEYPELKDIIVEAEFGSTDFIEKMDRIVSDRAEYRDRTSAGAELAAKYFSWDSTAEKILEFVKSPAP